MDDHPGRAQASTPGSTGQRGRRSVEGRAARRERHAGETDPTVVLEAAARFLQARPRSVVETRRRLAAAGYPAALIEEALARLIDIGILDDAVFARAWLESRDRARPRGERALRQELSVRGVDRETIATALGERRDARDSDESDEAAPSADEAAATYLLERRSGALRRLADPRLRRQRAYALLSRNGFDPGVCADVAARFAAGSAADIEALTDEDDRARFGKPVPGS